jgi:Spy/CpxP family protein refolding chaperone
MTTMLRVIFAAGALVLALALPTALSAQDAPRERRHAGGAMSRGLLRLGPAGLPLQQLDLSDGQREQVRGIVESHAAAVRDVGARMHAARQGLEALVTADVVDEASIREKSAEVAGVEADFAVLRARIHHELLAILTAEQQARARELRAAAEARRRDRRK